MRIAQLAPLSESVPPKQYGGTELVLSVLTEGLVAAGHDVTLFASGDSVTSANLVSVVPSSLRQDTSVPVRRWPAYALRQLLELQYMQNEFDIVHNHMGFEAFALLKQIACKSVSTNHNPIKSYCAPLYLSYADLPFVAISDSYRRLNFPEQLNYAATIYNGIDVEKHQVNGVRERHYLLFVGRVCQDKGTHAAIEIARRLKLPLVIAGKVDQADRYYFDECVKPYLRVPDSVYIGEVNFERKMELYAGAKALLYPICFDEPFGLVLTEALAAGTPVMALSRGSVPEVITDGETGIVANSVDELVARFSELQSIQSEACRRRARSNFSKERMIEAYSDLYEAICAN
ncbi:MAG: glycosyltransferase family 4 protein [Candidatus Melainabacteria bacterium]|nr:glycosyltransferase family 4 protein [Candidatus Melainabacteria bacterium]